MQVTYTHLNGETVVYTANTAVTSNVLLGNINGWAEINFPDDVANLHQAATTKINGKVTVDGMEVDVIYCYREDTTYVSDYGFSEWAKERLSEQEYLTFQGQCAVWSTLTNHSQDPNMLFWWKKFTTDPNVSVAE